MEDYHTPIRTELSRAQIPVKVYLVRNPNLLSAHVKAKGT